MELRFFKCIGLKEDIIKGWSSKFEIKGVYPSLDCFRTDGVISLATPTNDGSFYYVDADQFIEINKYEIAIDDNNRFYHNTSTPITEERKRVLDIFYDSFCYEVGCGDEAYILHELKNSDNTEEQINELLDEFNNLKST